MQAIVITEDYQPGNGSRYFIQLTQDAKGVIVLTWFSNSDVGGTSFRFSKWVSVSEMTENVEYFMEKMKLKFKGDALVLLERVTNFAWENRPK
jgi:hypothetical protein